MIENINVQIIMKLIRTVKGEKDNKEVIGM